MTKELTQPEGSLIVERSMLYRGKPQAGYPELEEHQIRVRSFLVAPATVTLSAERTENLLNYESAKVKVSITLPCYAEEVPPMLDMMMVKVPAKVEATLDTWLADIGYNRVSAT